MARILDIGLVFAVFLLSSESNVVRMKMDVGFYKALCTIATFPAPTMGHRISRLFV